MWTSKGPHRNRHPLVKHSRSRLSCRCNSCQGQTRRAREEGRLPKPGCLTVASRETATRRIGQPSTHHWRWCGTGWPGAVPSGASSKLVTWPCVRLNVSAWTCKARAAWPANGRLRPFGVGSAAAVISAPTSEVAGFCTWQVARSESHEGVDNQLCGIVSSRRCFFSLTCSLYFYYTIYIRLEITPLRDGAPRSMRQGSASIRCGSEGGAPWGWRRRLPAQGQRMEVSCLWKEVVRIRSMYGKWEWHFLKHPASRTSTYFLAAV